ncbi:GntR family transcriptional regulator [Nocardia sp. BMG51109]|uniref:GntR family transcriptional regulator n=1 Tax=Nocardia sp. BMG51109 TaxID=1056816 RepID=UPI0004673542|nr:GntR family transcriptional regulator [Nocardia sp. BMG51109]
MPAGPRSERNSPARKAGQQPVEPRPGFVRPKTAQQAAADALRQDITTGRLAPGTPIVQEVLAEQFGMSRIPVREALKTLAAEEYVTYEPHSGYRVVQLGLAELTEIFRIRDLLEQELIRDAMREPVSPETVDQMRAMMADMEVAAAAGDLVAVGVANRRFHFLTFERSRMSRTKRIVNQLWNTADPYRPLYAELMDLEKVNSEHVMLLEAVEAGDVERVVALNHQHRSHAIDHLTQILGSPGAEEGS